MIALTLAAATTSTLAIGVTVAATLVVATLVVAAAAVVRSARALRQASDDLASRTAQLIEQVGTTVTRAGAELERVEDLVGSAEAITERVGAASRLAYVALSNPLIKMLALSRGTARASKRLRWARTRSDRQRRIRTVPGSGASLGPAPDAPSTRRRRAAVRR